MFDISKKKAFVCDLDGTLFMGPNPIKPAVDFVIRNTKSGRFRYFYLTNNTSKCPEEYMKKIAGAEIPVTPEQILTPLITLEAYIREKGYRSVYLISTEKVRAHMAARLADADVRFEYDSEDDHRVIESNTAYYLKTPIDYPGHTKEEVWEDGYESGYTDGMSAITEGYYTKEETDELLDEKQDTLVAGENIKTINGESILGEGDINIEVNDCLYIHSGDTDADRAHNLAILAQIEDEKETYGYVKSRIIIEDRNYELQAIGIEMIWTSFVRFYTYKENLESTGNPIVLRQPYVIDINRTTGKYTRTDLGVGTVNIKTINGQSIVGTGNIVIDGGQSKPFDSVRKLGDYFYEIDYSEVKPIETDGPVDAGGCSCIVTNGMIGRNYDWLYNHQATFMVRTPNSIGIASHPNITASMVDDYDFTDDFVKLPHYMQDGINSAGIFAEINVVPASGNTQNTPLVEVRDRVSAVHLVRYILDHYTDIAFEDIFKDLRNYVQIYMPEALTDMGYEVHWLISDGQNTNVIELNNNQLVCIVSNKSTNFRLYGVTTNVDGTVETQYPGTHTPEENGIEPYGTGLERWNYLATNGLDMDGILFSKAYTLSADSEVWYSDFVGGTITNRVPYSDTVLQARIA